MLALGSRADHRLICSVCKPSHSSVASIIQIVAFIAVTLHACFTRSKRKRLPAPALGCNQVMASGQGLSKALQASCWPACLHLSLFIPEEQRKDWRSKPLLLHSEDYQSPETGSTQIGRGLLSHVGSLGGVLLIIAAEYSRFERAATINDDEPLLSTSSLSK